MEEPYLANKNIPYSSSSYVSQRLFLALNQLAQSFHSRQIWVRRSKLLRNSRPCSIGNQRLIHGVKMANLLTMLKARSSSETYTSAILQGLSSPYCEVLT